MTALEETMQLLALPKTKETIISIAHKQGLFNHLFDDFYQHIFIEVTNTNPDKLIDCIANNKLINLITTITKNQTTADSSFYKQFRNSGFSKGFTITDNIEDTKAVTFNPLELQEDKIIEQQKFQSVLRTIKRLRDRELKRNKVLGHTSINLFVKHYLENYTAKQLSEETNVHISCINRTINRITDEIQIMLKQEKIKNNL